MSADGRAWARECVRRAVCRWEYGVRPNSQTQAGSSGSARRVLVVGLDGATFDVLRPLAQSGLLRNLDWLLRRSAQVEMRAPLPAITPVAWSTFLTGCDPQEHGIWDFRYFDHARGRVQMNHAGRLGRGTLFDVVSATGGQVVSLNLPMTYPPSPQVPGIIIGGIDSLSIEAVLAPYPEFQRRLLATSARYNLATIWRRRPETLAELTRGVQDTEAAFRGRVTAAHLADEMTDWQLLVVQFQTLDSLQHRCWHLLGVDPSTAAPSAWVRQAQQALVALDHCVGELCELADRRAAAVVLVSDHGFGTFCGKICVPRLLEQRGLLTPAGPLARSAYRLSRWQWKVRRWAHAQQRPGQSTSAMARPVESLLPVDRQRSAAVALHGSLGALVYLNTPLRFHGGCIRGDGPYDQAAAETLSALRDARHPTTGEPLFQQAYLTRDQFHVDPLEPMWPDVVGIPADGWHTRNKLDRGQQPVREDVSLTGTHRREGIFTVCAPGVAPVVGPAADLRDAAPTILHLAGLPPGGWMSGRVLPFVCGSSAIPRPHFLRSQPAVTLRQASADRSQTGPMTGDVARRLKDLGYLE